MGSLARYGRESDALDSERSSSGGTEEIVVQGRQTIRYEQCTQPEPKILEVGDEG